jgi:ABC-type branched-subunit amino acid transport system substrate-binding protein
MVRIRVLAALLGVGLVACSVSSPRNGADVASVGPNSPSNGARPTSSAASATTILGDAGKAPSAVAPAGDAARPSNVPTASGAPNDATPTSAATATGTSASAGGVTKSSITISLVYARSGPYGQVADNFYNVGFQTWLDDVNARGGINGRKIVAKRVDNAGTADGGVAACKEVLGNGSFLAMPLEASVASTTFADCMNKANRLTIGAFPFLDPSWRTVFASQPVGVQFGRGLATFVHGPVGDAGAKVGVIYLHEAFAESQRDGFLAEAKRVGLNVVDVEAVEPNQNSFTSVVLRMRQAGVTHLVLLVALEVLGIMRDAKAIQYTPHVSGVLWPSFDFVSQTGRDLLAGAWGLRYVATLDSPAFAAFEQKAAKYGHRQAKTVDGSAFLFYGDGLIMERVLQSAGTTPTDASLRAGIASIHGYDNGILPAITWGPDSFEGSKAQFPARCCSDDWTWRGAGPARASFS